MARSESRKKTTHIPVRATPDEKAALQARAAAFGISCAELVRQIIFGAKPKAIVDQAALSELQKCRADLGRLGGVLKGWMGDSFPLSPPPDREQIKVLLAEIEEAKKLMESAGKKLVEKL